MKKTPFFARFLEKQHAEPTEAEATEAGSTEGESTEGEALKVKTALKAGRRPVTLKYPSDRDEFQTMKYPSDDDEGGTTL